MTTVDILFRYAEQPTETVLFAISGMREVYGIRNVKFDRAAHTVRVEYDATRLTGPIVANLLRRAGVEIVEELPLIPPPAPEPEKLAEQSVSSAPGTTPAPTPAATPATAKT